MLRSVSVLLEDGVCVVCAVPFAPTVLLVLAGEERFLVLEQESLSDKSVI